MARLQDFQSVTPAGSDNLLIVQSQGQGLSTLNAVGQKVANETTMSSLNTTSKNLVGAINEVKEGIPINKGGHATDLSTTGLSTGTYLYKYDSTTNGIPTAGTEGDCYITINNTQSWGCELAVSNSGLFWRKKENQVWGSWEDIIGKLTTDTAQSSTVLSVNGTYQIPSNVLKHNIIIVSLRRQGRGNSNAFSKSDLLSFDNDICAMASPNSYYKYKVSSSGLITINDIVGLAEPYVIVTGIL